jgi:hypothetical protein
VTVILALLVVALLLVPTSAGAFTFEWFHVVGSESYEVEQSTDGKAWTVMGTVTLCSTVTTAGKLCTFTLPNPTTGRVLWRVVSVNAGGRTPSGIGFWLDADTVSPPPAVDAVEVKR